MFNLTYQERQVILFLITLALTGLGINSIIKANPGIERIVKAEEDAVKIDINKATLQDLLSSQAITPKLAEKIIEYRDGNGPFRSIEYLEEIKGIGKHRLEKLKAVFFVR